MSSEIEQRNGHLVDEPLIRLRYRNSDRTLNSNLCTQSSQTQPSLSNNVSLEVHHEEYLDEEVTEANGHPNNENDDDSFHDLEAVLALVAASEEGNEHCPTSQVGSSTPAASHPTLIGTTHSTLPVEEECKEEISEGRNEEMTRNDGVLEEIPRYYAATISDTMEEATVLETSTSASHIQSQQEDDARLAAALMEEEETLLALKRSAYEGGGSSRSFQVRHQSSHAFQRHQEADILEITQDNDMSSFLQNYDRIGVHSLEENTVQAEWIGQDFTSQSVAPSSAGNDHQNTPSVEVDEAFDITQEAMVIDSGPLEKNQESVYTEEAQVLLDEEIHHEDMMDRKPAARERNEERNSSNRISRCRVLGGAIEEALVLGIQERVDIHPAEFEYETSAAQDAELVRTDYSYTVAVPSTSHVVASIAGNASLTSVSTQRSNTTEATAVCVPSSSSHDNTSTTTVTAFPVQYQTTHRIQTDEAQIVIENHLPDEPSLDHRTISDRSDPYSHDTPRHTHFDDKSLAAVEELVHEGIGVDANHPNSRHVQMEDQQATLVSTDINMDFLSTEGTSAEATAFLNCDTLANPFGAVGFATDRALDTEERCESVFFHTRNGEMAEIVSIQDMQYLHPIESDETRTSGVAAELVGTISLEEATTLDTEDDVVFLTGATSITHDNSASSVTEVRATMIDNDSSANVEPAMTPLRTASAFIDPHQPNALHSPRRDSEDDLRAAIAAIDALEQRNIQEHDNLSSQPSQDEIHLSLGAERFYSGCDDSSLDWLQDLPSQQTTGSTIKMSNNANATASASPIVSARDNEKSSNVGIQHFSCSLVKSTSSVFEALFGEASSHSKSVHGIVQAVLPRTLLPWSIIHNPTTEMWVLTLQINQKALDKKNVMEASKSLRAFSMPTEKHAICLAKAWTPPRMLSTDNDRYCHICNAKFAMLRRSIHCRNCGVSVCKDCSVAWPKQMVPETYNTKRSNFINTCKSCDWLSNEFRVALLQGNLDKSVALVNTGNVNIHSPFANVKGELLYPIHCAVIGGNLECLTYLMDDNCCPFQRVQVSGAVSMEKFVPIVTSKGRSLLGIAMEKEDLRIIHYLSQKKGKILSGEVDITPALLARSLEKVLRQIPESCFNDLGECQSSLLLDEDETESSSLSHPVLGGNFDDIIPLSPLQYIFNENIDERTLSQAACNFGAVDAEARLSTSRESVIEECIICFDHKIDCVAAPCGHQMCCLPCSENLNARCPVCSSECSFMRVYKP